MGKKMKMKIWKNRGKIIKPGDVIMKEGKPTDFIIPIMGPTGVGKSTFINTLLGKEAVRVGQELESCTICLETVIIPEWSGLEGRLVIVDTPGFDDTYQEDSEILRRIAGWLAASYDDGMKLGGVIYLHDISQVRMKGTTRMNLEMFHKLCGADALQFVLLGTTKWDDVATHVGHERQNQLAEKFWSQMTKGGAKIQQFHNTQESAKEMINTLVNASKAAISEKLDHALQIQTELVNMQRYIPETEAGQKLRYSLKQLLEMQQQAVDDLRTQKMNGQVQAKYKETQEKIRATLAQLKDLEVPLSRRIMAFLGFT